MSAECIFKSTMFSANPDTVRKKLATLDSVTNKQGIYCTSLSYLTIAPTFPYPEIYFPLQSEYFCVPTIFIC